MAEREDNDGEPGLVLGKEFACSACRANAAAKPRGPLHGGLTAARWPPRRTQTRRERTAASVTLVRLGMPKAATRPGQRLGPRRLVRRVRWQRQTPMLSVALATK